VAVFPTNDELTTVYAAAPMTEFASARADLEGHYLRTLDLCGDLGGARPQRRQGGAAADHAPPAQHVPCPHGPGWALAGDVGSRPLADALHDHQRSRDPGIRGMYDFTVGTALRIFGTRASASSRQPACCPQRGWCRGQGVPGWLPGGDDAEGNSHRRQPGLPRDHARSSGGLVPWWLTGWRTGADYPAPVRITGAVLTAAGGAALLAAFAQFAIQGRGTPAPPAPTRMLPKSTQERELASAAARNQRPCFSRTSA
jgi:hypothetical protein